MKKTPWPYPQISNFNFQILPHLLIWAVIAFSSGIASSEKISPSLNPLLPFFFFLTFLTIYFWQKNNSICLIFLFLFLFLTGLVHGSAHINPPSQANSLYQLFPEKQETTLVGTLLKSPATGPKKTKLLLDVSGYISTSSPHSFQLAQGKIQISINGHLDDAILPGDTLLVRTVVSQPHRYGTPGSFDYQKFLARKSIWTTGWVRSTAHIKKIEENDRISTWKSIRFFPENIRHRVNVFLENNLPMPHSALYKAILTGERQALPPYIIENFKTSGSFHLLAISGLHMGLIAVVIGTIIRQLISCSTRLLLHTPAWKIAALLIIPILCFYALIAGFQTPVVRSLIMTCVFLTALLFDRQHHIPTNIAIAVFIILLVQPAALFTVSFQLSFAAVISMTAIMPHLLHKKEQADKNKPKQSVMLTAIQYLKGAFFLSMAAQIGTFPLLLFYFNRVTPFSSLATLVIEPFLCLWALTIGLFAAPLIFIFPPLALGLFKIGTLGLTAANFFSSWFASLPYSSIWLSTPSVMEIIIYYILLFSLLRFKKSSVARLLAISSCALLMLIPITATFITKQQNHDRISFLDVGQGNATVLELAGGYTALIDGGGAFSDRFNVGEMLIAPFLWGKKITHLDVVIISHPDADHFNGLPFIVKHFKPKKIWINGDLQSENSYESLLDIARAKSATVHTPQTGEMLFANSTSTIFNVADLHIDPITLSDNDKSLVIALETRSKKILFTGDISKKAESLLVKDNISLQADILQLPHHGSATSSSKEFLDTVSPDYAIISAGKHKTGTFPATDVVSRCQEAGIRIYNTATDGTITVTVTNDGMQIETWKNEDKSY